MMELLHIHFSFLCRSGRSNKKRQSPIVLRVIYRQERRDIYAGLYCKMEVWDTTNSKVFSHCKQAATLKQNLDLINYKSMQVFKELKFSGVPFSIDELTRKLKGKEERSLLLIEYLTSRNEELSRRLE